MDILGVQGVACYYSFKGDHEDYDSDDRGKWQNRLGKGRDWSGDVRDELKPKGHMHVVFIASKVDLEGIGDVYDETGWVIKRITKSEDSNISIEDDEAMARAVTYALSHSMVYETQSGQRRLAAWMKGPDVDHVTPTERNKWRMKGIVRSEAETTLNVPVPSFECSNDYRPLERRLSNDDSLPDFDRSSQHRDPLDFYCERPAGPEGTETPTSPARPMYVTESAGYTGSSASSGDAGRVSLPSDDRDGEIWSGSGTRSASACCGDESEVESLNAEFESTTCSGHIKHISCAGRFLLDAERREVAPHADDLETAYRSYVDVMNVKGADSLTEGRNEIIEFENGSPPD